MDRTEINLEMEIGNTALHCAAISGNVEVAKAITMNGDIRRLATARGNGNHLPIYMAAEKGNREMVMFLYEATISLLEAPNPTDDLKNDFKKLLITLIKSNINGKPKS